MEIITANEGEAIGTDTPHAEIHVNADGYVVEGQYKLSIIYLGKTTITDCIDSDISTSDLKRKLEELSNIDSVQVD